MQGFAAKENPLCGRRGPFSGMALELCGFSPPPILVRQNREVLALNRSGSWLVGSQHPRCRGRPGLELRYPRFVFRSEIQQPLFGEGVSLFGETAAAFCLFFQSR